MIPIRDDTPRYTTPFINYLLIALNTLVFLFEVSLNPPTRNAFVYQFGVEPIRVLAALGLANVHIPSASALPLITSESLTPAQLVNLSLDDTAMYNGLRVDDSALIDWILQHCE